MAEVLLIVDMQVRYPAAQDRALCVAIEGEAERLLHTVTGARVVAINFDGSGMSSVKLPPDTHTLWKKENDGGDIVYSWLLGRGIVDRDLHVRVCGVNFSACVIQTAIGLGQRLFEEHGLVDNVTIESSLCGDGALYRLRIRP